MNISKEIRAKEKNKEGEKEVKRKDQRREADVQKKRVKGVAENRNKTPTATQPANSTDAVLMWSFAPLLYTQYSVFIFFFLSHCFDFHTV